MPWINHLLPACWPTFWKSTFKQQLGCRFDIMDHISSLFWILTYAIVYVLIHHIIFRLYLYFLNIVLNFFKYSWTNSFHRLGFYNFYQTASHRFSYITGTIYHNYIDIFTGHAVTYRCQFWISSSQRYDANRLLTCSEKWLNNVEKVYWKSPWQQRSTEMNTVDNRCSSTNLLNKHLYIINQQ